MAMQARVAYALRGHSVEGVLRVPLFTENGLAHLRLSR
jgi:hypothetical protein